MQSTHNQIKELIKKKRRGNLFFANDFKPLGLGDSIRQVLSRLCKDEFIIRLSNGIYLYPKKSKLIGIVYPSIEDIAKAIAKKEKARLIPTGVYALNKLGLTAMKEIDYTTHDPETINFVPPASVMDAWKKDYEGMQEYMIYGKSLPFNKLIERIKVLNERFREIKS